MKYGRLRWFSPDELDGEQKQYYDRLFSGPRKPSMVADEEGRLLGAFNARLLDPKVGTAIQEFGAALRYGTSLTARERELVILTVARFERCDYEWNSHLGVAKDGGLTEHELDGIRDDGEVATFSAVETMIRRVARALLVDRDLSDELFEEAERVIGDVRIFDVISIVGHYQHTALAIRVWRVPLRAEHARTFA
jgi:4-carboxymuconolactone decarboxylase